MLPEQAKLCILKRTTIQNKDHFNQIWNQGFIILRKQASEEDEKEWEKRGGEVGISGKNK